MKIKTAEFLKSAVEPEGFPPDNLPEIAFAGRSNSGKSTLINALVRKKKLAQTSRTPGKTRLINFFLINEAFRFVDLPGYGYAKVPMSVRSSWKKMVESYLGNRKSLKAVVLIIDARRGPQAEELQILHYLEGKGIPAVIAMTKADKLRSSELRKLEDRLLQDQGMDKTSFTFCSSKKNLGINELRSRIASRVVQEKPWS